MKIFLALITSLFALTSTAVFADHHMPKGVDVKQLFSNEKAAASIVTLQPEATLPSVARPGARAGYFIQGSTIERIYEDGKVVKKVFKTGETAYFDPREDQAPYALKNVGKGVFKVYVVNIKYIDLFNALGSLAKGFFHWVTT
jgi:hypothetical protein